MKKTLIIVGSAPCVLEDIEQALSMVRQAHHERPTPTVIPAPPTVIPAKAGIQDNNWIPDQARYDVTTPVHGEPVESCDFLAVGMDAMLIVRGRLQYACTYHPDDIPAMREKRAAAGLNTDYILSCHVQQAGVHIVIPHSGSTSGSSALLGFFTGLKEGYEKMILCGCPLTGKAPAGNAYEAFRPGWTDREELWRGKIKSMSGWTREFMGFPSEEWLWGE